MLKFGVISTVTFDPDGWQPIQYEDQTSGLYEFQRQAAAIKTLDGGVFIDNMGVFDSGRVLTIASTVDDATMKILNTLCRVYSRLLLSTEEGVFAVCPMQFGYKEPTLVTQLVIVARIA